MSPASSGALEVEKYIGACLFSSQSRNKGTFLKPLPSEHVYASRYVHHNHHVQQGRTAVDGWAGGLPLISFANYQRRNNARPHELQAQDTRYPLSRLAVHTQGAPLILTNRYDYRKNRAAQFNTQSKDIVNKKAFNGQNTDTVSINSDESSGSANSENVLPRIIKPRKRRKKDRKPLHLVRAIVDSDEHFSTDSGSPNSIDLSPDVIYNPYPPFSFEQYSIAAFNKHINDTMETPKLHHSFDDIQEFSKDVSDNQTSSCQCRYCDPSGQIWDVDRHCYSPFLTTPIENQSSSRFLHSSVSTVPKRYDTLLPSNLMECMENLSLENSSSIISNYSSAGYRRDLEVSTKIVTSLNGHRDLEIKFFSTPTVFNSDKRLEEIRNQEFITKPVICK